MTRIDPLPGFNIHSLLAQKPVREIRKQAQDLSCAIWEKQEALAKWDDALAAIEQQLGAGLDPHPISILETEKNGCGKLFFYGEEGELVGMEDETNSGARRQMILKFLHRSLRFLWTGRWNRGLEEESLQWIGSGMTNGARSSAVLRNRRGVRALRREYLRGFDARDRLQQEIVRDQSRLDALRMEFISYMGSVYGMFADRPPQPARKRSKR